ncbi:pyruvate, phosphate dikinase, partial [bacterium]|nr:pyruvate, phosphate dikinase [bacterium]
AILEATVELIQDGKKVLPEIMVPVVGIVKELDNQKILVDKVYREVCEKYHVDHFEYMYGTMIEIPRAALTAGKIAETAEFFSYGTNDLTQMGFGFSRDDIGGFVPDYVEKKILPADPFNILDQEGIGELIQIGIERGRRTRPKLKVGICGEHGGEPSSVGFCHRVGMDYVSCSPYRVPIARLAAAQAALKDKKAKPATTAKPVRKAAVKAPLKAAKKAVKKASQKTAKKPVKKAAVKPAKKAAAGKAKKAVKKGRKK